MSLDRFTTFSDPVERGWRPESRKLLKLAAPIAAAQAGVTLMGVVDTAIVGRLGAVELAAVGLGNTVFFAICIVAMGVVMGIDPLIAQALGAGATVRARRLLWQGVWLAAIVGVATSAVMALLPLVIGRIGIEPEVVRIANSYLLIRILSVVPTLLFLVVRGFLQAHGITRPMLVSTIIANVFNLFADILFVFGGSVLPSWTGPLRAFPALGVPGAAIATVLGTFLQLWIIARAVKHEGTEALPDDLRKLVPEDLGRATRIGVPHGLQMGAEVGIFALVSLLAGRFGSDQLAAHQVAITLASFTFTFAVGIGAAGSVRVGRAIGARDQEQTRRAGFVAFGVGAAFMSIPALTFLIFPRFLAELITDNPTVLAVAIPLLAVAAVFQISDGVQAVGAGVLRGAGDTRFAFVANIIGHWLVGFPIALLLGFRAGAGIVGLWWGLCAGLTAVAILLFVRFYRRSSEGIAPIVGRGSE